MPFPVPELSQPATSALLREKRATLYERPGQPGLYCHLCRRPYKSVWELHIHNSGLPVDAFAALILALAPAPGGIICKLPYGWQIVTCRCHDPDEARQETEAIEADLPETKAEPATPER